MEPARVTKIVPDFVMDYAEYGDCCNYVQSSY